MSVLVGTKKGLFTVDRAGRGGNAGYDVVATDFLGAPCTAVLDDARDGTVYAALDHGHFGVKLHRRDPGDDAFREIAVPEYPERPADATDVNPMSNLPVPWALQLLWTLAPGHAAYVHLTLGKGRYGYLSSEGNDVQRGLQGTFTVR